MPLVALAKKRKRGAAATLRDLSRRRLRKLRNVFIPDQPGLECVPALEEDKDMEVVTVAEEHLKSMASFVKGTKVRYARNLGYTSLLNAIPCAWVNHPIGLLWYFIFHEFNVFLSIHFNRTTAKETAGSCRTTSPRVSSRCSRTRTPSRSSRRCQSSKRWRRNWPRARIIIGIYQ